VFTPLLRFGHRPHPIVLFLRLCDFGRQGRVQRRRDGAVKGGARRVPSVRCHVHDWTDWVKQLPRVAAFEHHRERVADPRRPIT
jgi:hypothetical protein